MLAKNQPSGARSRRRGIDPVKRAVERVNARTAPAKSHSPRPAGCDEKMRDRADRQATPSNSYKMSCDGALTLHGKARLIAALKPRAGKTRVIRDIKTMALRPQKAPASNQNAASEETQQETAAQQTEERSEVEETAENKAKSNETAQQQHDAQPEVEKQPREVTLIIAPKAPEAEDDNVRRDAAEFALRWSAEAEQHVKGKSAEFVRMVTSAAYARIYLAEAILCGAIAVIPIGRVAPIDAFDKWWTAFKVGDLWFVLRYHDKFIREYELTPAFGPTPGDGGDPPPMTRQQRRPPPQRIGPRPRVRRNRGGAQGSRATKQLGKAIKKKARKAKRIAMEFCLRAMRELEVRSCDLTYDVVQLWRQKRPRLLRSVVHMRRACGSTMQFLRDVSASFVQVRQEADALVISINASFTRDVEVVTETYGPSGQLEASYEGHTVFPRLRLNSWRWKTPPIAWNEYLFGVDWTKDIFGVQEEEQAFT